jgi:uncharacterized YkwD family protein
MRRLALVLLGMWLFTVLLIPPAAEAGLLSGRGMERVENPDGSVTYYSRPSAPAPQSAPAAPPLRRSPVNWEQWLSPGGSGRLLNLLRYVAPDGTMYYVYYHAPVPEPQTPAPRPAPPRLQPEPEPTPPALGLTPLEAQLLELVNAERVAHGAGPLVVDEQLVKLARMKSQDMIDRGYFDHISPTYGSPFEMMRDHGVSYKSAGENLAGAFSVESAHRALMNSPGHRRNLLNPGYTHVGIGIVQGGPYGLMVTQLFVRR